MTRHTLRRCAPNADSNRYAVHDDTGATRGHIRHYGPGRWSYKERSASAITITAPTLPQLRDEIRRFHAAR
jgi:hypothetical protein